MIFSSRCTTRPTAYPDGELPYDFREAKGKSTPQQITFDGVLSMEVEGAPVTSTHFSGDEPHHPPSCDSWPAAFVGQYLEQKNCIDNLTFISIPDTP